MNCEYCQSPVHIWFQCPKKPDGWKPARLAKRSAGTDIGIASDDVPPKAGSGARVGSGRSRPTKSTAQAVAKKVVNNTHGTKPLSTMGANPTTNRSVEAVALTVDTNSRTSDKGLQHLAPEGVITTSAGSVGNKDRQPNLNPRVEVAIPQPVSKEVAHRPVTDLQKADTNGSEAQKVGRRSPKPEDAGSIPATSAKFDKKAWMKAYMKIYMRKRRAKERDEYVGRG